MLELNHYQSLKKDSILIHSSMDCIHAQKQICCLGRYLVIALNHVHQLMTYLALKLFSSKLVLYSHTSSALRLTELRKIPFYAGSYEIILNYIAACELRRQKRHNKGYFKKYRIAEGGAKFMAMFRTQVYLYTASKKISKQSTLKILMSRKT